jgi:hypothetical protein
VASTFCQTLAKIMPQPHSKTKPFELTPEPWGFYNGGRFEMMQRGWKMKFITICISFVIALVITSLISCSQQNEEWTATIEVVDGVTVVKNPTEPKYGLVDIALKKDLIIGSETDENYQFLSFV